MDEKRIAEMMKLLDISRDEAIEIIKDDEAIDKGEKLFELTPEQKKVEKKMKNAGIKTVDAYGKTHTRTRKEDNDKRQLIEILRTALKGTVNELDVTNIERQLDFTFNGRKFRIVLSAPRK